MNNDMEIHSKFWNDLKLVGVCVCVRLLTIGGCCDRNCQINNVSTKPYLPYTITAHSFKNRLLFTNFGIDFPRNKNGMFILCERNKWWCVPSWCVWAGWTCTANNYQALLVRCKWDYCQFSLINFLNFANYLRFAAERVRFDRDICLFILLVSRRIVPWLLWHGSSQLSKQIKCTRFSQVSTELHIRIAGWYISFS